MTQLSDKPPHVPRSQLNLAERLLAATVGVVLLVTSAVVMYRPPVRRSGDLTQAGLERIHFERADPTTYTVALLTAGALLIAFSFNGRRIRRISRDGAETEDDGNEGQVSVLPPPVNSGGAKGITTSEESRNAKSEDTADIPTFDALTPEERKVLGTLWAVQWNYEKQGLVPNWGFTIHPESPEYSAFWRGRNTLLQRRLILVDLNGLVGLTSRGVEFCRMYDAELRSHKDIWRNFAPLSKS